MGIEIPILTSSDLWKIATSTTEGSNPAFEYFGVQFELELDIGYIYIYNQLSFKSHGCTGIPKNIIPTAPSTLWKKYVMPIKSHEFQISIKSQF